METFDRRADSKTDSFMTGLTAFGFVDVLVDPRLRII